ncbi:MAG: YiiD C-terminal domain-containing protein [Campylobacteraceae bacterium]|nr:YiiD C-terminal domain-containing protein [Campylobacteraceae bacterium]
MLKKLKEKLHKQIPLTKYMQISPEEIKEDKLITTAPIEPNINDKQTGFAGSLSTLVTISAWSACYLVIEEQLNFKDTMIAVIKSDTSYRAPVTKNLYCETTMPNEEEIKRVKEKLDSKGSASLRIKSQIIEDEKVCVDFEGIYVIKI